MNKKVVLQIGCFIAMFVMEMIAVNFDQPSAMFNLFMILALLMIPAFVLVKYVPAGSKDAVAAGDHVPAAA